MNKILISFLLPVFALSMMNCGEKPSPQGQAVKGGKVVCILFNEKRFKTEVVKKVSQALAEKGYTVASDRPKYANIYSSEDYAAVVYMTEFWMWHTPRHAISYYNKNNKAGNIIIVVTSGANVVIKKPFDAITSASRVKDVDRVSEKILNRLGKILGK
ncbi:MAG: hypothetical protein Q8O92_07870 [Candidatus Latescibacter sp.]|nr:hypothetical protein [Candidatus Latescibacter sp.]